MEREAEAVWGGSGVAFQLRFGDGPGNVQTLASMLHRHKWSGRVSKWPIGIVVTKGREDWPCTITVNRISHRPLEPRNPSLHVGTLA